MQHECFSLSNKIFLVVIRGKFQNHNGKLFCTSTMRKRKQQQDHTLNLIYLVSAESKSRSLIFAVSKCMRALEEAAYTYATTTIALASAACRQTKTMFHFVVLLFSFQFYRDRTPHNCSFTSKNNQKPQNISHHNLIIKLVFFHHTK